jgi:hypothetical protein
LADVERIRDLRALLKATMKRLDEIEKEPRNEEEMIKEKITLKAIEKEILRLERHFLFRANDQQF